MPDSGLLRRISGEVPWNPDGIRGRNKWRVYGPLLWRRRVLGSRDFRSACHERRRRHHRSGMHGLPGQSAGRIEPSWWYLRITDPSTRPCAGINLDTNEIFEANYDFAKPKSATIFKTIVDPFLGKYSMIKVCSGVIKSDDVLYNVDQESEEKLSKLYVYWRLQADRSTGASCRRYRCHRKTRWCKNRRFPCDKEQSGPLRKTGCFDSVHRKTI